MRNTGGIHAPTEFWVERIDKLQAQRDKLLAACKLALNVAMGDVPYGQVTEAIDVVRAAIKEAEDTP